MSEIKEISEISTEDEEEEAAEGSKHNDKLHNKCGKANEAKYNCSCNLSEGLLETKIQRIGLVWCGLVFFDYNIHPF